MAFTIFHEGTAKSVGNSIACLASLAGCSFPLACSCCVQMTSGPIRRSSGEVRFDLMYDDLKGKTKASNVTGGSGGTLDFGAPTSRHHLGKRLHQFTAVCAG